MFSRTALLALPPITLRASTEQGRKTLVNEQVEPVERLIVLDAVTHDLSGNGMRVAEGHAFLYEVVGNVRRGGKSSRRRIAHPARIERKVLQKFGKDGKAA